MSSNRLLPYQFAPGIDASPTRIEQSLMKMADLYDDVPPDLVQRRWSPSYLNWGFAPPRVEATGGIPPYLNPYMDWVNVYNTSSVEPVLIYDGASTNPYRVKSNKVDGISFTPHGPDKEDLPVEDGNILTWEVSMLATHPMIIGSLVVSAFEGLCVNSDYDNKWLYGAGAPTPHIEGDPTEDFTLQVCISDGWDLENRKKLRQESLTYKMKSSAFAFSKAAVPTGGDTTQPQMPISSDNPLLNVFWDGFMVVADALVLVPAGARLLFQWSIPNYNNDFPVQATWQPNPVAKNIWSLRALCYSPTR